ncbi:allantoinase AllB [candidate division KSB1 bacterium]|nr:allantoinase AllB [candidate division KSB1 bacterium]
MSEINILQNVFVSHIDNQLKLADIYFTDKIETILPKSDRSIRWNDIAYPKDRTQFRQAFQSADKPTSGRIYDGNFLLAIPGAIDAHVHFNTPGFEHREDFDHASLAAAYGGVTTVFDMPCTSVPPVTSVDHLNSKYQAVKDRSYIDYAFWGGVSGAMLQHEKETVHHIQALADAGVVGFKVYCISGMDSFTDLTYDQIETVARWVKKTGLTLGVHAEDKQTVLSRQHELQRLGRNDWRAYCEARDAFAESEAVSKLITIAQKTDCHIHIVHLSSERALEMIRKAKSASVNITTETCPHYLHFTQHDFDNPNIQAFLKTAPPVKSEQDKDALWQGLRDGTIDYVTTDHAGCDPLTEKSSSKFWDVYGGIPGVEHRVPFLISEGFKKNRLTLSETIDLLSTHVADRFKLDAKKGALAPGKDADIVLVDMWDRRTVRSQDMHSKGKYTPFQGFELACSIAKTFLRGRLIMDMESKHKDRTKYGQLLRLRDS